MTAARDITRPKVLLLDAPLSALAHDLRGARQVALTAIRRSLDIAPAKAADAVAFPA